MNEFDQYMKHVLKVKHYGRYTDDFIIISENKQYLSSLIKPIQEYLSETLKLTLHPHKVTIRKYAHGIDFLGSIILPHCRLIRKRTKKRMVRKLKRKILAFREGLIEEDKVNESLGSYLGILSHANEHAFGENLKNQKIF